MVSKRHNSSGDVDRGARIDPTGCYRYLLWRIWEPSKPLTVFIGLNPSTADGTADDPTLRRCMGFARTWGHGGVVVVNLFGFRATRPADLKRAEDPIGSDNWRAVEEAVKRADQVVACWGVHGGWREQDRKMLASLKSLGCAPQCLGTTKAGYPRHPLYVRGDRILEDYSLTSES